MRKLRHEEIPRPDPETLASLPRHPVVVVADNIRSIYNVGSIFRTSDAARIAHLYLTGHTGTPENKNLYKTALGSEATVPWTYLPEPGLLVDSLRKEGYTIAVLEITDTPTHPSDLSLEQFPLCLILGNEVFGVRDELVERADVAVELPQFGAKQSLNVAVAYGVAILEIVKTLAGAEPASSSNTVRK